MPKDLALYENGRFNQEDKVTVEDCPFHQAHDPINPPLIVDETDIPHLMVASGPIHKGQRTIFVVICGDCGAMGPWGENERHAVQLWNRHTQKKA
jgi:hypothetical protein